MLAKGFVQNTPNHMELPTPLTHKTSSHRVQLKCNYVAHSQVTKKYRRNEVGKEGKAGRDVMALLTPTLKAKQTTEHPPGGARAAQLFKATTWTP